MKDAFENNFKQSLENFEVPYDGAAWNAMQSRLDASASAPSFEDKMKEGLNANEYTYNPAAWAAVSNQLDKGNKGGFKPWYLVAGLIGTAAVATLLIWNASSEDELPTTKPNASKQTQTTSENTASNTDASKNTATTPIGSVEGNSIVNDENVSTDTKGTQQNGNTTVSASTTNDNHTVGNQSNTPTSSSQQNGQSPASPSHPVQAVEPLDNPIPAPVRTFILPALPETVCEGDAIQIENENDYPIVIIYPNGLNWVGRKNQVTRLNPSIAGTYEVGFLRNDTFKKKSTFVVNDAPVSDFDFVDLSQKYLDGLPTIEVRSTVKGIDYSWEYENATENGEQVGLHFFKKGLHPVQLTVTSENGCATTTEKMVNVDDDYNLLAMTAFFPNGNNSETNTFMPFALMERDVDFNMIIIDPNDGHIMFETSEASSGWNGMDQLSGRQAPLGKSYIWKVTVMNPEKGEDSNYKGTVLTLQQ